jgi:DNA replication initiation complex subunit (GINS family)
MELITFEAIYDMVRKEKGSEELQQLNPNTYALIAFYLRTKLQIYKEAKEKNLADTNNIESQLSSARSLTRELYERRERKITQLALNKSRTQSDKVDLHGLLESEKKIFEELVILFDRYRKEQLLEAVNARTPAIEDEIEEGSRQEKEDEQTPKTSHTPQKIEPGVDTKDEKGPVVEELLMVKFLAEVPKFYGPSLEIYGPFKAGDIANLPKIIANILLHKKVAI